MSTSPSLSHGKENQNKFGFIDLVFDLVDASRLAFFPNHGHLLAEQSNIQTLSYNFADRCFSGPHSKSLCGKRMQLYLAKIDITEIGNGLIDLSSPTLHQNKYSSAETIKIFKENNKALAYLKDPFSDSLKGSEFTTYINDLAEKIIGLSEQDKKLHINNFLNLHKSIVAEVVLFSKILNIICASQSLYAFAHQLSLNTNFIKIIEFSLIVEDGIDGFEHVRKLAERYFSVFIGNLAVRVFSNETLEVIESAFSAKE